MTATQRNNLETEIKYLMEEDMLSGEELEQAITDYKKNYGLVTPTPIELTDAMDKVLGTDKTALASVKTSDGYDHYIIDETGYELLTSTDLI